MNTPDRFDHIRGIFSELPDGRALYERLEAIDRAVTQTRLSIPIDQLGPDHIPQFDVLLLGGGLSLLYALVLAQRGNSVCVMDRAKIGQAHRAWNASDQELSELTSVHSSKVEPVLTIAELNSIIERRYESGFCRFGDGQQHNVTGVLDIAVDAQALLSIVWAKCLSLGVTLLDFCSAESISIGRKGVRVRCKTASGHMEVEARLLLDGLGAASPFATPDLFCPTVGFVLGNIPQGTAHDEYLPNVGEILVTTEGVYEGRQHVWEGFPGRRGLTTYLFHYAESHELGESPLRGLYERFFRLLPRYKRGALEPISPTFGVIPGSTRLRPHNISPYPRVLLVGDAAARHSPLTFCGFGALIRSIVPVGDAVTRALSDDQLDSKTLRAATPERAMLPLLGALALMLTGRGVQATKGDVNGLFDSAFATLGSQGPQSFGRFLRDEATPADVIRFLYATSVRRRSVYTEVSRALQPRELLTWTALVGKQTWQHYVLTKNHR